MRRMLLLCCLAGVACGERASDPVEDEPVEDSHVEDSDVEDSDVVEEPEDVEPARFRHYAFFSTFYYDSTVNQLDGFVLDGVERTPSFTVRLFKDANRSSDICDLTYVIDEPELLGLEQFVFEDFKTKSIETHWVWRVPRDVVPELGWGCEPWDGAALAPVVDAITQYQYGMGVGSLRSDVDETVVEYGRALVANARDAGELLGAAVYNERYDQPLAASYVAFGSHAENNLVIRRGARFEEPILATDFLVDEPPPTGFYTTKMVFFHNFDLL